MSILSDWICSIRGNCPENNTVNVQQEVIQQQLAEQQAEAELKAKVALERNKIIGRVVIIIIIVVVIFLLIKKFYR